MNNKSIIRNLIVNPTEQLFPEFSKMLLLRSSYKYYFMMKWSHSFISFNLRTFIAGLRVIITRVTSGFVITHPIKKITQF